MHHQRIVVGLVVAASAIVGMAEQLHAEEHAGKSAQKLNVGGIEKPGGTIKGIVKFDGKQIPRKPKKGLDADKFCANSHKDAPLLREKWVFGKNETLQNVFVYVSKGLENKKFDPPAKPVILDQRGCAYVPHVSGVVINQKLYILNSDDTLHNIKIARGKKVISNNAMQSGANPIERQFSKRDMPLGLQCDVHRWMNAYLHVMEHPFFAVTQEEGTFEIKGLPPGTYEVSVWHEFSKFKPDNKSVSVTVCEGETKEISFTYTPPKPKKKNK